MQPANFPVVLSAIVLAAACWAASGYLAAAAAEERGHTAVERGPVRPQTHAMLWPSLQDWGARVSDATAHARALFAAGYEKAPALVIALCAVLMLPMVALASLLMQAVARRRTARAASRSAELRTRNVAADGELPAAGPAPLWSQQAWLSREDGGAETLPLAGQMIRIGRHHDNDIRLPDALVHRYHAVIEHTVDEAFVITDLSGSGGNGLRINGERLAQARLTDGDVIELGRTRLRFESVAV